MFRVPCRLLMLLSLILAPGASADDAPDSESMVAKILVLADDAMGGRGNGTPEMNAAADTIAGWFQAAGLAPRLADGYLERFPLDGEDRIATFAPNVVGVLEGAGDLADRFVVIGAHYDHLGFHYAEDGTVDGVYNGAEDNASGVAVICELARLARAADAESRRTLIFVSFAGEEIGLQGSSWFVSQDDVPLDRVDLMLNIDSVGRLRNDRLYVGGVGSADGLRDHVVAVNASHGLDLQLSEGGWDASDHVVFNNAGVPVLFLFTGPHPQYHSVDDTADLIAPEGLEAVAGFAWDVLDRIARHPQPLAYRRVAEVSSLDPERGKDRAWLGTIPDFVDEVQGVKLAGVMPDSPAEEAGLAAGDVLVGLGEAAIGSLQDLTVALRTYGAGTMVDVSFLRGEEKRTLPITLRPRPR